jgi:hypothetical protein
MITIIRIVVDSIIREKRMREDVRVSEGESST